MTSKYGILLATVGILHAAACGTSDPATVPDANVVDTPSAELYPLPGLLAGGHLGMWTTYESVPVGLAATLEARLAEARTKGMTIGRVHVSWAELEPTPGQFDLHLLQNALDALTRDGLAAHVLIETV